MSEKKIKVVFNVKDLKKESTLIDAKGRIISQGQDTNQLIKQTYGKNSRVKK